MPRNTSSAASCSVAVSAKAPASTFVFADLAGFTALTEAHGDDKAVQIAVEFVGSRRLTGIGLRLLFDQPLPPEEKEGLVAAVVDFWNPDRAAEIRVGLQEDARHAIRIARLGPRRDGARARLG